jgi:transcriptional regulator with XRE-family HTH domain
MHVLSVPPMAGGRRARATTDRAVFGSNVRRLRTERGYSQEELAERSGLHRTYVSSLERGQRNVGLDNIKKLAAALGVKASELLDGI